MFPGGSVVKNLPAREFPGGPGAKTLCSQNTEGGEGGAVRSLVRELVPTCHN